MNPPSLDEVVRTFKRHTDYMQRNLTRFRAPLKESTIFTSAGRTTLHHNGERVIYGPNGAAIGRVTEDPHGGTQVEEADRLHAVVRPQTVTKSGRSLL